MKAFVTVVDDNGRLFCKDRMIVPVEEEIVNTKYMLPIKETRFSFTITQLADFQTLGAELKDWG